MGRLGHQLIVLFFDWLTMQQISWHLNPSLPKTISTEIPWSNDLCQFTAAGCQTISHSRLCILEYHNIREQLLNHTSTLIYNHLFAKQFGTPNYAAHGGFCSINPVRTGYSAIADEWVPIRPGTDGALFLALTNEIIKQGLYEKNNCVFHYELPRSYQYMRNWNQGYLEWAKRHSLLRYTEPVNIHIYSEVLQKFRLAAQGKSDGKQPPDHLRKRVETHFDPLPFYSQPLETQQSDLHKYPLNAITQRRSNPARSGPGMPLAKHPARSFWHDCLLIVLPLTWLKSGWKPTYSAVRFFGATSVSVDEQLEHGGWVIGRTARFVRLSLKSHAGQVQFINENIDHAYRAVFCSITI